LIGLFIQSCNYTWDESISGFCPLSYILTGEQNLFPFTGEGWTSTGTKRNLYIWHVSHILSDNLAWKFLPYDFTLSWEVSNVQGRLVGFDRLFMCIPNFHLGVPVVVGRHENSGFLLYQYFWIWFLSFRSSCIISQSFVVNFPVFSCWRNVIPGAYIDVISVYWIQMSKCFFFGWKQMQFP
jgi:hypothetical protein